MMADRYWLAKFAERRDPFSELASLFLGLIPRAPQPRRCAGNELHRVISARCEDGIERMHLLTATDRELGEEGVGEGERGPTRAAMRMLDPDVRYIIRARFNPTDPGSRNRRGARSESIKHMARLNTGTLVSVYLEYVYACMRVCVCVRGTLVGRSDILSRYSR